MSISTVIKSIEDNLSNAYTKLEEKGVTLLEHKNIENLSDTIDSIPAGEDNLTKRLLGEQYSFSNEEASSVPAYFLCNDTGVTSVKFSNCTSIGDYAFNEDSNLTNVNFPSLIKINPGIKSFYKTNINEINNTNFPVLTEISTNNIGTLNNTFAECSNLISINNSSITRLGCGAFQNCNNLTSISLPNCKSIFQYVFRGCTSLVNINLPSIENLTWYAFYGCSSVKNISLPNLTSLGGGTFYGCSSLESIDCPKLTQMGTSINDGGYIFNGCNSLKSINFPLLTQIGYSGSPYNFKDCTSLEKLDDTIFPSLVSIEANQTFYGCNGLKYINLSLLTTVTNATNYGATFGYCTSLETFNAPLLQNIARYFFRDCKKLEIVKLPSISTIPTYAFFNCSSLKSLVLANTSLVTLANTDAFTNSGIGYGTGFVYVPDNLVNTYKSAANWSTYASQIKPISEYVEETE